MSQQIRATYRNSKGDLFPGNWYDVAEVRIGGRGTIAWDEEIASIEVRTKPEPEPIQPGDIVNNTDYPYLSAARYHVIAVDEPSEGLSVVKNDRGTLVHTFTTETLRRVR